MRKVPGSSFALCHWCKEEIYEGEKKEPFGLGYFLCEKCYIAFLDRTFFEGKNEGELT